MVVYPHVKENPHHTTVHLHNFAACLSALGSILEGGGFHVSSASGLRGLVMHASGGPAHPLLSLYDVWPKDPLLI